ncbi:hypothetical protein AYI69_g10622 [Smittium culicis]|uniref:CCHC-type domain-containing protein n=1 Tax=Smittium culicis TaxID=133412 RepID=A0A1R1X4L6_9FUNG|nr:hypothetical protein AYI69_g10622 [Smittium culicis]
MIKTEIFPQKFTGSKDDATKAEIWIKKFKSSIKFSKISDEDAVELFKLWLKGDAAKWKFDVEDAEKTEQWDFLQILEKFQEYFVTKKAKNFPGDVFSLMKLSKEKNETMEEFNREFKVYLKRIDKKMYTIELIKKAYVVTISRIDNNIWWQLAQKTESLSLEELMKESCSLMDLKIGASKENVTIEEIPVRSTDEKSNTKSIYRKIDYLVIAMENLTLLAQKNSVKSYENITCFTCGTKGHSSNYCTNRPANPTTSAKSTDIPKMMLAVDSSSDEENVANYGFRERSHKRMRVEDLINDPNSQYRLLKTRQKSLNKVDKLKVLATKDDDRLVSQEVLSYFVVYINGQKVPIFLDSGARHSLVDSRLVQ